MAKAKMGLVQATALVFGNMVGSGVYLLPASLAAYGFYSLGGWLLTSVGAVILALVFASLGAHLPAAGGPYAYSRLAFGDLVGFLVAWGYWIALWSGNAAIAVAFVGAMSTIVPWIGAASWHSAALAIGAIWTLTAVNAFGVRSAGAVQVVTSVLKMLPLLAVAFFGLRFFDPAAAMPLPTLDIKPFAALGATAVLTLWAFLGLESATVPAESVENPKTTIPRATVLGTVAAACLYIVATLAIFAIVPQAQLATAAAPFALAADKLWGSTAATLVALGAAISAFGTLNGWILLQAQLPMAAAKDGLFPAFFAKVNRHGAPLTGLVVGSTLQTVMIFFNYTEGLVAQFTFIILLATMATLVPYVFSSAGLLLLLLREPERFAGASRRRLAVFGSLGFIYALLAIGGSGAETVYWGFLLLLLGIPFYIWQVRQKGMTAEP